MTTGFPHLSAPGRVGRIELPNRLVMAPMDDNMADRDGRVTDQKIAWYERRARGGAGWITVGCTYVTPAGRGASLNQLAIDTDEAIPGLQRLVDRIHAHGARAGIQLCHAGRQTTSFHLPDGLRPEAPSALTEPLLGEMPTILTRDRILEIVDEFGDAARRARDAGFDCVEIHGAHGFLQHIFLSPLSNLREDEYGGSLENRSRFSIQCIEAIRAAVGDDLAVGFRLPCDDATEGGVTPADALALLGWLEQAGLDYVNVTAGRGGSYLSARLILGPPGIGPGHLEPYARLVKAETTLPVLSAGRYDTPELAERVLANGSADFIVMGRSLIADPDLPAKAFAGRRASIRPCVACEQGCIDRWFASLDVTCTVNPEAGREFDPLWQTIDVAAPPTGKRVLVVGGGPAGLEAARTARLLGHAVDLWEAEDSLGGQLRLAARAPHQSEWASWLRWLEAVVRDLRVTISTGRRADAAAVVAHGADAVVVATGARPVIPREIPGWNAPHVIDTFAALAGSPAGERVVVLGGETVGARTALALAATGHDVTLVAGGRAQMSDDGLVDVAYDMLGEVVRPMVLEWLAESVRTLTKRVVKRITPEGVVVDHAGLFRPHAGGTQINALGEELIPADTVVVGARRRCDAALFEALEHVPGLGELHLVGDATAPRTVTEAMLAGSACGRSLLVTPAAATTTE